MKIFSNRYEILYEYLNFMNKSENIQAAKILRIAKSLQEEIVQFRRTFHQFPEPGWKEVKTAERITNALSEDGLDVNSGFCGTGIVAEFKGSDNGKTVAVRADMDALPMYDAKDVPYASKIAGFMHACGHDSHMAMAIGVAKVLKRLKMQVPGNVRFIFQPSEESTPSGAHELVKAGVMDGVDSVFAFHVDPEIPAGKIGLRKGVLTAYCNEIKLTIVGKSGHAARPHQAIDTIFLSNQVLSALYDIVGNRTQTFTPAVLSIGKIEGGTKANIIPERVEIFGTIRTLDEQSRQEILAAINDRVHAITHLAGGSYQLEILESIPSVINDSRLTDLVRQEALTMLNNDSIVNIKDVSLGGEDFSWFLTKAPGVLIRLGVRKKSDDIRFLHTHNFDIDERALPLGVALMSQMVIKVLLNSDS